MNVVQAKTPPVIRKVPPILFEILHDDDDVFPLLKYCLKFPENTNH